MEEKKAMIKDDVFVIGLGLGGGKGRLSVLAKEL